MFKCIFKYILDIYAIIIYKYIYYIYIHTYYSGRKHTHTCIYHQDKYHYRGGHREKSLRKL